MNRPLRLNLFQRHLILTIQMTRRSILERNP
jgi:hypothetical protein